MEKLIKLQVSLNQNGWVISEKEVNKTKARLEKVDRVEGGIMDNSHRWQCLSVLCTPESKGNWIKALKGRIKLKVREIRWEIDQLTRHI